jgi:UDP-glucose 4-epimerase
MSSSAGFCSILSDTTSTRPTRLYGATKAATEAYLLAMAAVYGVRGNVIRPGYTFGTPVVEGASISHDKTFETIIKSAKQDDPIHVTKGAGTQFIWAGDLAQLYAAVLTSQYTRELFTGVGTEFVTWEEIAGMAVAYVGSHSRIVLDDSRDPTNCRYDVGLLERAFGFRFVARDRLTEYIAFVADTSV